MASRDEIVKFLDQTLRIAEIKDSSCNGLQVQGAAEVTRVGLTVDACLEAYEKAAAAGAQMLIVHHGLIWKGLQSVTGRNYKHIQTLLRYDLNLYAAHLPLDMHEQYGNNIQLARTLGLRDIQPFGKYEGMVIGYQGTLDQPVKPEELARRLSEKLGGRAIVIPSGKELVRNVGVVSGGAADMMEQAAAAGLDCYVTGEPVHFVNQLAREVNIAAIFLGHYHSETVGVEALGHLLTGRFGLESVMLDIQAFTAADYIG